MLCADSVIYYIMYTRDIITHNCWTSEALTPEDIVYNGCWGKRSAKRKT